MEASSRTSTTSPACASSAPLPVGYHQLADAFLKQDDITLAEAKDYITEPKPNGYRSLPHRETPIFLHDQSMMRVEVQFRTISGGLVGKPEHKIRYKKDLPELDHVNREAVRRR